MSAAASSAPRHAGPDLRGRAAVVTGAGSGIGRAFATALSAAGADVWLVGRREEPLRETSRGLARSARIFRGDIGSAEDVASLAAAVERAHGGRLHVLVNNAAVLGPRAMLKDYPPEEFESVLKTNVFGTYRVTWSLLPLLRAAAPGSVVVNMSSGVGRKGRAGWGGYAAGKFAVEGLTQVWADELRPEGVRVCALNPGATRSAMRAAAAPGEDPMSIPAPDAIVPALLWILSPEAQAQGLTGVSVDARDFVGWSG